MNKLNLAAVAKNVRLSLSKHSPEILTGIGIAGMVTTTVLAVKATPKALQLIEEAKKRKQQDSDEKFTKVDVVKACWKCYIPAIATGVTSVACVVGASSVNARRNAALATAYTISETALKEYKEKVIETVGEKKEKEVREKVAKAKVEKKPVQNQEVINTERGTTLCYDYHFGRYFRSDRDTIVRAMTDINRQIVVDMYASLNDFYDAIGLDPVKVGYDLGWNIDDGRIEVDFSSQLATDGTPCLVVDYSVSPHYKYSNFV